MRQRITLRQPEQEFAAGVLVEQRVNEAVRRSTTSIIRRFISTSFKRDTPDQGMTP